jgi:hypothetical protein
MGHHIMLTADNLPAILAAGDVARRAILDPAAVSTPEEIATPAAYPHWWIIGTRVELLRRLLFGINRESTPLDPSLPPAVRKTILALREVLTEWYSVRGGALEGGLLEKLLLMLEEMPAALGGPTWDFSPADGFRYKRQFYPLMMPVLRTLLQKFANAPEMTLVLTQIDESGIAGRPYARVSELRKQLKRLWKIKADPLLSCGKGSGAFRLSPPF